MEGAGFVATFLPRDAVRIRGRELAADAGAAFVNAAVASLSDLSHERDASRAFLIRAFHHAAELVEVIRQVHRDAVRSLVIGLAVVERSSEVGATRATGETGVWTG